MQLKPEDGADVLKAIIRQHGASLPGSVAEYTFHPTRKWRFDMAWPDERVAAEVDGGQWKARGGRHGGDEDRVKCNEAAVLGWRVLHFSPAQLGDDPLGCVGTIARALGYYETVDK